MFNFQQLQTVLILNPSTLTHSFCDLPYILHMTVPCDHLPTGFELKLYHHSKTLCKQPINQLNISHINIMHKSYTNSLDLHFILTHICLQHSLLLNFYFSPIQSHPHISKGKNCRITALYLHPIPNPNPLPQSLTLILTQTLTLIQTLKLQGAQDTPELCQNCIAVYVLQGFSQKIQENHTTWHVSCVPSCITLG